MRGGQGLGAIELTRGRRKRGREDGSTQGSNDKMEGVGGLPTKEEKL